MKLQHLASLACAAALGLGAGLAQAAEPPGGWPTAMVDDPCPPPLAAPAQTATDAERQAYQQEQAKRAQNDWPNLCRYKADNAAVQGRPIAVFIGDSITQGWARMDQQLFRGGVIGRGISGQTTPQMLVRFYPDVVALRPAVVHIMAGTNDVAGNTGPTTVQDFKNNIMAMVDLARSNDIRVVLASIPPAAEFRWRPVHKPAATIVELNNWLRSYAAENRLVYVDYHTPLADRLGAFKAELAPDGVHPNAQGYAVMRPLAEQAIRAAVGRNLW